MLPSRQRMGAIPRLAVLALTGLLGHATLALAQDDPRPPAPCTECVAVDGGRCTKPFTMTAGQECFCERNGQPVDGYACSVPPAPPPTGQPPATIQIPGRGSRLSDGHLLKPRTCDVCYYRLPGLATALSCQVAPGKPGDACTCSVTSPRRVVPLIYRGKMCVSP